MLKFKQCLHKDIWNLFQSLIIMLGYFKCNFKVKNETFNVFWRKQILFSETKKMDAEFASTKMFISCLGWVDKTFYKQFPKTDY